jgi:hypothetical protein
MVRFHLVILLFCSLITSCDERPPIPHDKLDQAFEAQDFEGVWIGYDYQCLGSTKNERLQLTSHGNDLVAIKLDGDGCIPKNENSWSVVVSGNPASGLLFLGRPDIEGISFTDCSLYMISKDSLLISYNSGVIIKYGRID